MVAVNDAAGSRRCVVAVFDFIGSRRFVLVAVKNVVVGSRRWIFLGLVLLMHCIVAFFVMWSYFFGDVRFDVATLKYYH